MKRQWNTLFLNKRIFTSHLQNKSRNHDICITDFSSPNQLLWKNQYRYFWYQMNFRPRARQRSSSQDQVSPRMFIFQANDTQFATHVLMKQSIFRVFCSLKILFKWWFCYLMAIYRLQSAVKACKSRLLIGSWSRYKFPRFLVFPRNVTKDQKSYKNLLTTAKETS